MEGKQLRGGARKGGGEGEWGEGHLLFNTVSFGCALGSALISHHTTCTALPTSCTAEIQQMQVAKGIALSDIVQEIHP